MYVPHRDDWFLPWEANEVLFSGASRTTMSDVWSFGTVMWEVFMNGKTPFAVETPSTLKAKVGCLLSSALLLTRLL
jgi:serine/threonine protein kinase